MERTSPVCCGACAILAQIVKLMVQLMDALHSRAVDCGGYLRLQQYDAARASLPLILSTSLQQLKDPVEYKSSSVGSLRPTELNQLGHRSFLSSSVKLSRELLDLSLDLAEYNIRPRLLWIRHHEEELERLTDSRGHRVPAREDLIVDGGRCHIRASLEDARKGDVIGHHAFVAQKILHDLLGGVGLSREHRRPQHHILEVHTVENFSPRDRACHTSAAELLKSYAQPHGRGPFCLVNRTESSNTSHEVDPDEAEERCSVERFSRRDTVCSSDAQGLHTAILCRTLIAQATLQPTTISLSMVVVFTVTIATISQEKRTKKKKRKKKNNKLLTESDDRYEKGLDYYQTDAARGQTLTSSTPCCVEGPEDPGPGVLVGLLRGRGT
ncbi:hypothetical protein SELMODRAFT_424787 [Selaginella moellendorffii]|uniref:Uncharacterized protein n=1 Tax=Selaginella moellendorffii TaxID=88036 RepID=D8SR10_SELML|nr:hypothetical protein SELMODRAFT_424787 [Selaginella moellendorffii]